VRDPSAQLGAQVAPGGAGVSFAVWAPHARRLELLLDAPGPRTHDPIDSSDPIEMTRGGDDVFETVVPSARAGCDYRFRIDGGRRRPDPRSRHQPHGVHGPSRVVDPGGFRWSDAGFRGLGLEELVVYELHVGTFTREGTFDAVIPRLAWLRELGVTAVEIMPVAEFPGGRNWGYDGVHPFAPQSTYGGPDGLQRLVDACHRHGLAVLLDVVYNHLGPEGSCLPDYAPCFTGRYRTPWGDALNYDGPDSDGVRRFVIDNAVQWVRDYHVDGLRLDAVHGIFDSSARHILEELASEVHAEGERLGRRVQVIAESDLNDVRVIAPAASGGFGHDAQWSDDFHHSAHVLLTGDGHGYFADFGKVADLARAIESGFVYDGRRSLFRRRRHGSPSRGRPGRQFVVCLQNHDQVANASRGARLANRVDLARQTLGTALLLCAPNVPLLFMGQEFGAVTPFHYFVSHGDPALVEAVRAGRRRELESFRFDEAFADPQAEETFERCRLDWSAIGREPHARLLALHRDLLALRRARASLRNCRSDLARAAFDEARRWLALTRSDPSGDAAACAFNFGAERCDVPLEPAPGRFELALSTCDPRYGGDAGSMPPASFETGAGAVGVPCAPWSAAIYVRSAPK